MKSQTCQPPSSWRQSTEPFSPAYAKLSHDLDILSQGYLNAIGMIALPVIPAGLGIGAMADLVVISTAYLIEFLALLIILTNK
jgi:hypothetical protein